MLTWGTSADFRYFTPRILEQAAAGQWVYSDLEIAFGRLGAADWRQWPSEEATAVERVLELLWRDTLSSWPGPYGADPVLCALGNAVDDLGAFLDCWVAVIDSEAGARHLRQFIAVNIPSFYPGRRLANAFWPGRGSQAAQVAGWLMSPRLKDAVTEAYLRAATPAAAHALAEADQYL
jgi:hypothetical protein